MKWGSLASGDRLAEGEIADYKEALVMNESAGREKSIFAEALALPASERAAYLEEVCAGELELKRRLEKLFAAQEEGEAFFEGLERDLVPAITRGIEGPGKWIGCYLLHERIGEGGCGVVYRAEQQEPVQREVALKIIKLGMDTEQVVARFEAERQTLALMDHPHIARVLDAGATETGRPYFVMELVRGTRITHFCDEHRLSIWQRLDLFIHICRAIHHAHQKGVIHRDIKPSNILVAMQDGAAVPKVIDFGVAKAMQGRLAGRTVFTGAEQFIGTPAYMSPEQAEIDRSPKTFYHPQKGPGQFPASDGILLRLDPSSLSQATRLGREWDYCTWKWRHRNLHHRQFGFYGDQHPLADVWSEICLRAEH
jgi:serine/threonine protein kinase